MKMKALKLWKKLMKLCDEIELWTLANLRSNDIRVKLKSVSVRKVKVKPGTNANHGVSNNSSSSTCGWYLTSLRADSTRSESVFLKVYSAPQGDLGGPAFWVGSSLSVQSTTYCFWVHCGTTSICDGILYCIDRRSVELYYQIWTYYRWHWQCW